MNESSSSIKLSIISWFAVKLIQQHWLLKASTIHIMSLISNHYVAAIFYGDRLIEHTQYHDKELGEG